MTASTQTAMLTIGFLKAAWPRQVISQETADVYVRSLDDIDPQLLRDAVAQLIKTSLFFPSIAEIRATAAELACQFPQPAAAWEEVQRNMSRCHYRLHTGWERAPVWSHPLVERAVRALGGLRDLQDSQKLGVERSQFLRIYADFRADAVRRSVVEALSYDDTMGTQLERRATVHALEASRP